MNPYATDETAVTPSSRREADGAWCDSLGGDATARE
jgi:hypothetical protein